MTTSSLDISPRPELVRIARMMSVALARRGGLPEPLLDEVRVAVGEAVSRAVLVNAGCEDRAPVRLTFTEDDRGYEVSVLDVGDAAAVPAVDGEVPDVDESDLAEHGVPVGLDLALVAGMADEMKVGPHPAGGTLVRLRWTR